MNCSDVPEHKCRGHDRVTRCILPARMPSILWSGTAHRQVSVSPSCDDLSFGPLSGKLGVLLILH